MANVAAYSGLRWGELAALTIAQVSHAARVITVDRKVVEIPGCVVTCRGCVFLRADGPVMRVFGDARRTLWTVPGITLG